MATAESPEMKTTEIKSDHSIASTENQFSKSIDTSKNIPNESSTEDAPPEVPEEQKKTRSFKFVLTFLGLQISLFLAALDNTIVATSLPHIGSDFNEMKIVAWVATAYILTFDACQPLFSKFSDIFGRKWILVFGIVVFLFGSLLCALSKSMIMLIIFRAIAGIGAAGIFSMIFIIISDIVPLEKRGNYQGLINAVFALSSVLGPLIGGSLTDYVSWRWNFYINLPIGAAALAVILFFLKLPVPNAKFSEKLKRVDYAGTFIVFSFAVLFLLALNFGGQLFPWKSAAVIVPFILAGLLLFLLVIVENKFAKEPILPPRLFRNRSVVGILLTNWFMGMAFFSAIFYLPIYFQVVRNDSAMWSGIRLIPMQMVLAALSTAVGITISKTGRYNYFTVFGMASLTVWMGLTSLYSEDTPWSRVYGISIIGGAAMACLFSSTIIGLQASVDYKDMAVATGLGNFTRVLGGALGIAISSTVLNTQLAEKLPLELPPQIALAVLSSSEYVNHGLPQEYLATTLSIYTESLRLCWYVLTPMAGLGFFSSLLIKNYSMKQPGHNHRNVEKTDSSNSVTVDVPTNDADADKIKEDEKASV